jgi:small subunit ribosomal protein S6
VDSVDSSGFKGVFMADVSATYDLNIILDPNLDESRVGSEKDAIANQIERVGGSITEMDEWGNRRLAYPIRKLNDGYYIIYKLSLPTSTPRALEDALKLRDNIMRILVTRERPEWRTRKAPKPRESASQ